MSDKWFISDLHLGHELMIKVGRPFANIAEMNEALLTNWNRLVKQGDVVYVLGDISVGVGPDKIKTIRQFFHKANGSKVWILGNHDPAQPPMDAVNAVHGAFSIGNQRWILTHIPVHPDCLGDRFEANIHGHLHSGLINDPRYINVSVERIGYKPIHIDEVRELVRQGRSL